MKAAIFFVLAVGMAMGLCLAGHAFQSASMDYVQFIGGTLLTAGVVILIASNAVLLGVGLKLMLDKRP